MIQKFRTEMIFLFIGLIFNSGALVIAQKTNVPDYVKGTLFGIGIGLMIIPLFFRRLKQKNG